MRMTRIGIPPPSRKGARDCLIDILIRLGSCCQPPCDVGGRSVTRPQIPEQSDRIAAALPLQPPRRPDLVAVAAHRASADRLERRTIPLAPRNRRDRTSAPQFLPSLVGQLHIN